MRFRGGKPLVYGDPFVTGGGTPAWTPAALSPLIWEDFTDATAFTFASGKVASVANKGSAGGGYAQANAVLQPTFNSPSSHFTTSKSVTCTSGQFLSRTGMAPVSALTEFLVFKGLGGNPSATQFITSYGGYGIGSNNVEQSIFQNARSYCYSGSTNIGSIPYAYGTNKAYRKSFTFDASSAYPFGSPLKMTINGSGYTASASPVTAPVTAGGGTWSVGANADGLFGSDCEFFHLLVFDRVLTPAELAQLDAWAVSTMTGGAWG